MVNKKDGDEVERLCSCARADVTISLALATCVFVRKRRGWEVAEDRYTWSVRHGFFRLVITHAQCYNMLRTDTRRQ